MSNISSMLLFVFIIVFIGIIVAIILVVRRNKVRANLEQNPKQMNNNEIKVPAPGLSNMEQTESQAALSIQGDNPQIIAAIIGALIYTLGEETNRPYVITSVTKSADSSSEISGVRQDSWTQTGSWAQAGRNRLMQLRQDFALYKRREIR